MGALNRQFQLNLSHWSTLLVEVYMYQAMDKIITNSTDINQVPQCVRTVPD